MSRMQRYPNLSGASGVSHFAIGPEFIDLRFVRSEEIYRYSYRKPGAAKVEQMKRLARLGRGLSSFVSQEVGAEYESKREYAGTSAQS